MTRFSHLAVALVLSAGFATTAIADRPLGHFSADADVVIRLKAPKTTIEKVATLADAVQPNMGNTIRGMASGLGQVILVPGLQGVDDTRDWYLVIFTRGREMPQAVFAIPTTDADQLTSALPDRMTSAVKGDWVLYSDSEIELGGEVPAGEEITSVLTGELAAVFERGDLSVFVNLERLADAYSEEIVEGQKQVHQFLPQIGDIFKQQQQGATNIQPMLDMYGTMIDGVFQGLDDAGGLSIAMTVSETGITFEDYVTFDDDSESSRTIAQHPRSTMDGLARLPAGAHGYFGLSGDMKRLMDWSWSLNKAMLEDDPAKKAKFEQAMQQWQGLDYGPMTLAFSLNDDGEGLVRYMGQFEVQPVEKVRKNLRAITAALGNIEAYGMKQETTVEPSAEQIGSQEIDVVRVKQEYTAEIDPTGSQQKIMEAMFGPEGIVSRVAYLDDSYVMTMGGGRAAMERLLKSLDAEPHQSLAAHRAGLSEESNVLALVDLSQAMVVGLKTAAAMSDGKIPVDRDALDGLSFETSYIGFSLAGEPNALRAKTVIPTEQLRGIMTFFGISQQQQIER